MESIINQSRQNPFNILCKITDYESCQEGFIPFFKFIEYKIILKTNKKSWQIKKRFKDFDELHKKLSKNIKDLPKLPKKIIFKSEEILKNRKIMLQKYLTNLLRRDDVYNHDLIFDFILLKKEDYLLMKDNMDDESSSSPNSSPYYSPCRKSSIFAFKSVIDSRKKEDTVINDNFFYSFLNHQDEDEIRENNRKNAANKLIIEFLTDLNALKKRKDKSLVIEKFKTEFLFANSKKTKFSFKNEDIYKLFFGDKIAKKNGLLFYCGDTEGNLLGAESCIELLSNMIDFEYNLESEFYVNILRLGKLEHFKQMNLNFHLASGKPHLFSSCCRLIRVILNDDKNINFENLLEADVLIEKVSNYFLRLESD